MSNEGEAKRERLEKMRQARAEYDTVTVGGRTIESRPNRDGVNSAPSAQQQATTTMTSGLSTKKALPDPTKVPAPLYKFQVKDAFEHNATLHRTAVGGNPTKAKAPSSTTNNNNNNSAPTMNTTTLHNTNNSNVDPLALVEYQNQEPSAMTNNNSGALVANSNNKTMEVVDPDEALMRTIQQATSKRPNLASDVAVAPNDDSEICKLQNAEDTVSYFSVHGSNSSVKYVYLNRTHQSRAFRPYDLSVVLRGQQFPEHYVISSTGVVHIRPGHPSEVITLSEWMKESAMFNVLRRIRFFKHYLVYKAFIQWKNNIRLRLYCETRRRLCKKFFISKSTFAGPLMDLVKTSFDLSTTPLLQYEAQGRHDYTIDEFNNQQSRQRQRASVDFSTCLERMEAKLTKLTDTIQQRANVPDLNTMESLEQYLLANSVATGKEKKGSRKMKSMLEAKEEQFRIQNTK